MRGTVYDANNISKYIDAIAGNLQAYIHGSNSSSLRTSLSGDAESGHLIPRSRLAAKGLDCKSDECSRKIFRGKYGEEGMLGFFAYRSTQGDNSWIINEVAQFANYIILTTTFFPVIYVIDGKNPFEDVKYG